MLLEESKAIVRRFTDEVWSQGKLEVVDEIVAPNIIWHGTKINDIEAFKQNLVGFRTWFSDLCNTIDELVAEGDKVVARMTIRGTHTPTDKQATWTAIGICRIADAQIVEMWTNEDVLGRMQQIGYTLVPPEDAEP